MKVYRIRSDVNNFRYFLPEDETDWGVLQGDCLRKAEAWEPPPVYVFKPLHEEGDFYQFGQSILITSPRATGALHGHFQGAGELLPLPHGGREYTVLNVTECINCLDGDASEWRLGAGSERLSPTRYAFHPGRFTESTLFKIPETYRSEVLVVEGLHEPEEEFRFAVERAGLKGLVFEELWSHDGSQGETSARLESSEGRFRPDPR